MIVRRSAYNRRKLACVAYLFLIVALPLLALNAFAPASGALRRSISRYKKTTNLVAMRIVSLPDALVEPQQSLIYRAAEQPIGTHNGVAFWLMGDSKEGAVSIYLMASGGASAAPLPVPGSGKDTEPLWPAWISNPISTDFTGWHRILISGSDFTYRAPVGVDSAAVPPALQTADTFGIASTKRSGVLYVDGIVWANIDSGGNASGDSVPIANFSTGDISDWDVKGSPQAVQNLVPGIISLAQFVNADTGSLKLDYSGATARRSLLARSIAQSMLTSRTDYVVSVPASPFERILPDTLPTVNEISSHVGLIECPEQTSCSSFVIYSLHGMTNVSVHLSSDLYAIGKSIPKSNVNISVVKVWDRRGAGVLIDQDSSGPMPELLVKDDRVPLASVDGIPPDVRLTGDPLTDIPANTEKQFWIDVTVPPNTPAGVYTAQLVVKSTEELPFKVTLATEVLPLRLLSPAKQYVINYRGKLGDTLNADVLPGDHVDPVEFASDLADVQQHGFHYITLSDSADAFPQALSAEQQYNFQTPLVYPVDSGVDGLAAAEAVTKLGGDPSSYYYLVPDGPTLDDDLARLKQAGFQTAAVINNELDYNEVQNSLDVAIYPVDDPYVQELLRTNGRRESSTRDWLTWPAAQADPQVDRLYAGYLLWKSDLYGGYVSDYETCFDSNPYDDTIAPSDAAHCMLRPAMLTYPAQEGVIDTIQWESIREGINDVRYLTTYFSALRECKDAKVDMLVVAKAQTDVTNFLNQAFWLMSDTDYQNGRAMIANYALQLRKAVDSYNAHLNGASQQSKSVLETKRRTG